MCKFENIMNVEKKLIEKNTYNELVFTLSKWKLAKLGTRDNCIISRAGYSRQLSQQREHV